MTSIVGQLFALITALCWVQNSIVYSFAGKRVGSRTVTHIRLWVALPSMLLVHLLFTGRLLPSEVPGPALLYLSISGFIGFFLADLLIFRGFVDLGPRETLVVLTLSPIFATILSWFIVGEVLSPLQITGIITTIGGVMWVIITENRSEERSNPTRTNDRTAGLVLAFLGAVAQAAGMTFTKQGMVSGIDPLSANVLRISAGFAELVLTAFIRKEFRRDFQKMADKRALLLITSGALIGPVLGIIMTLYAFNLAPVGIVTTIMQTGPILLLPIDRFIFKKRIPSQAVIGTIVAVFGAMLLFIH